MEIKDIKIGDKVQICKDIPEEELTELLGRHSLTMDNALELQRRGEVTVKDIQEGIPDIVGSDWDSITLEESVFYWPIELFEPVNKPSKKEQVQEDILTIKDIIKRYNLKNKAMGGLADTLIGWLEQYGQDNLSSELEFRENYKQEEKELLLKDLYAKLPYSV